MGRRIVSEWDGAYLLEGEHVVRVVRPPTDPDALSERIRRRRDGSLTHEEEELLAASEAEDAVTADRRLAAHGVRFDAGAGPELPEGVERWPAADLRAALLRAGREGLDRLWDPSVHLQEAVRALADLDRARNLVGERLGSWVSKDRPEVDPGDHDRAAREVLEETARSPLGPPDAPIAEARRRLAELYHQMEETRQRLAGALDRTAPIRTPNLARLLGPELTARIIAQAGGLDRLARLPASTVQVLGAERAFFEHLRGRAPPPRHGLLFLHPQVQGASRAQRGRIARALAGKVAIAARLDVSGAPVREGLAEAFEARRSAIVRAKASTRRSGKRPASGLPLDRAAGDG